VTTELPFELKPLQKYTVECPECGHYREKNRTRTLTVYRDTDGFIRWQCSHAGQCSLNERQWAKDPSPEDVNHDMTNDTVKPLKVAGELPKTHDGNPLWWYKNDKGEPLYAVMRKDLDSGKVYYPVSLQETGQTVQLPNWPRVVGLYGQEMLATHGKVLVVEGEKTRDAAQALFPEVAVVAWRGGASNIRSEDFYAVKGKKVYLWPDNDGAGSKAMAKVAEIIGHENEVYLVDVSGFPEKSDLADNLPMDKVYAAIKGAALIHKPVVYTSSMEEIDAQEIILGRSFKSGWPEVDEVVRFPSSGVVVIEGRTGHAKTGTAVNFASNFLRSGGSVHYFSYEIPASRVFNRFRRLLQAAEDTTSDPREWVNKGYLRIYDQSRQLPLKNLKKILDNPDFAQSLVVIDYAQIVPGTLELRLHMIELMDSLRVLANTHGFLVLLLSQLTPDYSNPLLDSPAESKALHNSAEMVLRVWNKENAFNHPVYDDVPGNLILHVIKNRDGESGHLIGFAWADAAYMEPNGHIDKVGKHKKEENRQTKALETIADILKQQFGGF
jgi:hypothetical protein